MSRHEPDDPSVLPASRRGGVPIVLGPLFAAVGEVSIANSGPDHTRRDAQAEAGTVAEHNRAALLEAFRQHGPMTADQAGAVCRLSPLAARPRVSELAKGRWPGYVGPALIEPTGKRAPSSTGHASTVWRAVPPLEPPPLLPVTGPSTLGPSSSESAA